MTSSLWDTLSGHPRELPPAPPYGPMLDALQEMWAEHDERAQGSCGCAACKAGVEFFTACCEVGEQRR